MDGGVKYTHGILKMMKVKKDTKTYKNRKHGAPSKQSALKTIKRSLNLKKTVEGLISTDMEPNEFLLKAIVLIKKLLKVSQKDKKKVDSFVLSLVNALYYSLKKENNINYNSNNTEDESMNEDNIWNDPYTLLRTLVRKLEELLQTDNEEFKLEISEVIKNALKHGYDMVYVKDVEVENLSVLLSGTKL